MKKQKTQLNRKSKKGSVCWVRACRTSNFVWYQGLEENLGGWEMQKHQGTRNGKMNLGASSCQRKQEPAAEAVEQVEEQGGK